MGTELAMSHSSQLAMTSDIPLVDDSLCCPPRPIDPVRGGGGPFHPRHAGASITCTHHIFRSARKGLMVLILIEDVEDEDERSIQNLTLGSLANSRRRHNSSSGKVRNRNCINPRINVRSEGGGGPTTPPRPSPPGISILASSPDLNINTTAVVPPAPFSPKKAWNCSPEPPCSSEDGARNSMSRNGPPVKERMMPKDAKNTPFMFANNVWRKSRLVFLPGGALGAGGAGALDGGAGRSSSTHVSRTKFSPSSFVVRSSTNPAHGRGRKRGEDMAMIFS